MVMIEAVGRNVVFIVRVEDYKVGYLLGLLSP